MSEDNKTKAFRECYGHLHELRSLAPNAKLIALTATATKLTKETILNILLMEKPFEVQESPNKPNVTYIVKCMQQDADHELYFEWLVKELKLKRASFDRTIIYCQTIKQCSVIYGMVKGMLGKDIYHGTDNDSTNVLVEMLHSCTPSANKEKILLSYQSVTGTIRLLIATIAFGMGVDCKGVHRVIHYGPAKNVEAYIQETGRAGRDGLQSAVYILYHGVLLAHVDGHMKQYVKTQHCRRKELLKHFHSTTWQHEVPHLCCDNCAVECNCGMPDCGSYSSFPLSQGEAADPASVKKREVREEQRKAVEGRLIQYYKSIVIKLLNTTAHGDVKTLTNLQFMLGFSKHQITQVLDNLNMIFSLSDVYKVVEIWDMRHALEILSVISDICNDVSADIQSFDRTPLEDNEYGFDEELDEWNEILQDNDLIDMIVDNLSISQIENSSLEIEPDCNNFEEIEVHSAVLATVEVMNLDDQSIE